MVQRSLVMKRGAEEGAPGLVGGGLGAERGVEDLKRKENIWNSLLVEWHRESIREE